MPAFLGTAPTQLIDLLEDWRSESDRTQTRPKADADRLEKLLTDPEMENVWQSLRSTAQKDLDEIQVKLFLIELFRAAAPVPDWESLAPSRRMRKMYQIENHAKKLSDLLQQTPFNYFDDEALAEMHLSPDQPEGVPEVRLAGESDFKLALDDLIATVGRHRLAHPTLRRPGHQEAQRQFFIIQVNRYLTRRFHPSMYRELAVIAQIMLRDPEIDTEVVRLTLLNASNR